MQQVVVIHGGTTFASYDQYLNFLQTREVSLDYFKLRIDWKNGLQKDLGDGYLVLQPRMPDQTNAQYAEWKIWFERLAAFLEDEVILVGHSLGGLFLVKYLSENKFPKAIKAAILVAPPYDEGNGGESLGSFNLINNLELFKQQAGKISFYFSQDDAVVPPYHLEKYQQELPDAKFNVFEDRQHFNQQEFPELIEEIKIIK